MDPDVIDLSVYHVMHNTCIKHEVCAFMTQERVGLTSILCKKVGTIFLRSKLMFDSHDITASWTVETKQFMTERRKPVVGRGASREPGNEQATLNEVDTDFRIPGLPHSVVKQAQNSRVRDVGQEDREPPSPTCSSTRYTTKKAYKLFSAVSKQMIKDVGNVELFELFETDLKTQCKECLSYWSEGIVDCTCGHLLNETVANRCFIKKRLS